MASKYRLLTVDADAKTSKGKAKGYWTGVLYMAPGKEADGIHNMCLFASEGPEGCLNLCLNRSGRAEYSPSIIAARIARTLKYLNNREQFIADLEHDINRLIKEAKSLGLKPAVRINGTSDIPKLAMAMSDKFRDIQFYDYTKMPKAWLRVRTNYHLTFSHSGTNLPECLEALSHGVNVAVVFKGQLPATWNGYQVISGDEDDLRFLDPKGVVIGLRLKGHKQNREASVGGFVQIGMVA